MDYPESLKPKLEAIVLNGKIRKWPDNQKQEPELDSPAGQRAVTRRILDDSSTPPVGHSAKHPAVFDCWIFLATKRRKGAKLFDTD